MTLLFRIVRKVCNFASVFHGVSLWGQKRLLLNLARHAPKAREGREACDAIKMWKMGVQVETPSFFGIMTHIWIKGTGSSTRKSGPMYWSEPGKLGCKFGGFICFLCHSKKKHKSFCSYLKWQYLCEQKSITYMIMTTRQWLLAALMVLAVGAPPIA